MTMENKDDDIQVHDLFQALAKKTTFAGVPSEMFMFNMIISMVAFIIKPVFVCVWVPIHMIFYLVGLVDDNFFSIIFKLSSLPRNLNKKIWGVKSYEPY